jgi:hypothetical protein
MDSRAVNVEIRRSIWPILRAGGFGEFSSRTAWRHRLERSISDVKSLLTGNALAWFDRFTDHKYAIDVLLNCEEDMRALWGFGRKESPVRHYFIGYLAMDAGQMELAERHLSLAAGSGCFTEIEKRLGADAKRANKLLHAARGTRAGQHSIRPQRRRP